MNGVVVLVLTSLPLPRPQKRRLDCVEMLALADIVREGGRLEDAETRLLLRHLEDCERCNRASSLGGILCDT